MSTNAIASSLNAIHRDFQQLEQSALRVSRAGQDESVDLIKERVDQLTIKRDTEAQVKSLKTQDEMLGLILDLRV